MDLPDQQADTARLPVNLEKPSQMHRDDFKDHAMDYVTLPAHGLNSAGQAPVVAPPDGMVDLATWQRTQADLMRFQELVAQVGRELSEPLTAALERVNALVSTGRIDRGGLKALMSEVDRARQAGIWCQQISRLSTGRAHQTHERVHLSNTVQGVLAHRVREFQSQGLVVTQAMTPVEVQADAPLLFGLLNAAIDWATVSAKGQLAVSVDMQAWPAHGQLCLKFPFQDADQAHPTGDAELPAAFNSLNWHLLDQYARSMGVSIKRTVAHHTAELVLAFPHTISPLLMVDAGDERDQGFATSVNSRPLAGSHVLVVASRRDLRLLVRESLKSMGLVVDFVSSVSEAVQFCREALPHAIVFESNLRGQRFDHLVESIRTEVPEFVLVEVLEEGQAFDISSVSPTGMARVGREVVMQSLPSALIYELSRTM
jgi:CheY-like chemotaxis protein